MQMQGRRLLALAMSSAVVVEVGLLLLAPTVPPPAERISSFGTQAVDDASVAPLPSSDVPSSSPMPTESPVVAPGFIPRSLVIRAIDVDARVRPVGMDANRSVDVPHDIRIVGWYQDSARPGSVEGAVVLVAHRDGLSLGHGVFYDLGALQRGDRIELLGGAGERVIYRVVARQLLDKSTLAQRAAAIFALDGRPRLRLISCGGFYDPNRGGYQANVVVTALRDFG